MTALDHYRSEIDRIDAEIIKLLGERFTVTRKVGEYKRKHTLPAKDDTREAEQQARIKNLALQYGVDPVLAIALQKQIIAQVIHEHQSLKKVA